MPGLFCVGRTPPCYPSGPDLDHLQLAFSHILRSVIAIEPDHVALIKCRPDIPG